MAQELNVQIIGSGHSGSTLLDMMLGGHPEVSSLGEAHFAFFNARFRDPADRCTCGQHVLECPFWKPVDLYLAGSIDCSDGQSGLATLLTGDPRLVLRRDRNGVFRERLPGEPHPHRSLLSELSMVLGSALVRALLASVSSEVRLRRIIGRNLNLLYEAVREVHGAPVVVDSTKNPGTFKNVYLERVRPMHFILNVRDGRGVCYSRMRRQGVSMATAAREWRAEHLKRRAAQLTIPRRLVTLIRYEDLCTGPEQTLARLCERLGLAYDPGMREFRKDRHNLGGNPMRHRASETEIVLDETWRTELSSTDFETFDRIAGRLNRSLGYD